MARGRPRLPHSGNRISASTAPWHSDMLPGGLGVRRTRRLERLVEASPPARNSDQDPLCSMLVLAEILNIDEHVQISARELVQWLRERRPQYAWDAVTVGRILSVICEVFEDRYGHGHGLLYAHRLNGGQIYYMRPTPELVSRAIVLVEELYRMHLVHKEQILRFEKPAVSEIPLYTCESMQGEVDISDY